MWLLVTFLTVFVAIISAVEPYQGKDIECKCTKQFRQVCGTDAVTYMNPCLLLCAVKTNTALQIAHYGPCKTTALNLDQEDDIPCICNKIYIPVCGNDGKTYSNPCMLDCTKKSIPDLSISYDGVCKRYNQQEEIREASYCVCTFDYTPVCGSDGKTYSNLCMLNCMSQQNQDIKLAYEGACNSDICICNDVYNPICGSDAVTYGNLCELKCAQKTNTVLTKSHDGKCTKEDTICKCDTKQKTPMCGTDSKTYDNLCFFSCARNNNPELSILHEGECTEDDYMEEDDSTNDPCVCAMEYKPVCGTDSKTYSNLCVLNCVEKVNSEIAMAYEGPCDKNVCICNKMYDPICGNNGKTFGNVCEFECDQKWNPELKKAYDGACNSENLPSCSCNRAYKPTCGNDGKTYSNPCQLGCEQAKYPGLTMFSFGPCKKKLM